MNIENIKRKYDRLDMEMTSVHTLGNTMAMLYHENSKVNKIIARKQISQISMFENPYVVAKSSQPYKNYYQIETHDLEDYAIQGEKSDFYKTIENRHSGRNFDGDYKISLFELHKILFYSYGISKTSQVSETVNWSFRHVPSAGGLYPLELYVVILNGDIRKGLYHYSPIKNALSLIKEGDFTDYLADYSGSKPWVDIENASCVVLTTSVFERQMIKYGERAYRFILMETGFVAQNINLVCEHINLASCMVGFYYDDKINELLEVNGVGETIQNILVIGKEKVEEVKQKETE
ncbi:SagB/ThcOx family dehydrogenase [Pontimicrobium sp. MEBiC01747]